MWLVVCHQDKAVDLRQLGLQLGSRSRLSFGSPERLMRYLGVIPAQLTQEHPGMHGGGADKEHRYHVLVALFDSKSGERITDASVKATVSSLGMGGSTEVLEPMHGEALSYGNYFSLLKPELYRVRVEIQRGKDSDKSVAKFVFLRPRY